jgi:hypothetical protein
MQAPAQPGEGEKPGAEAGGGEGDAASKFTNPTALLTSYNWVSIWNPVVKGTNGQGFQFLVRPVVPVPKSEFMPLDSIIRVTGPISSTLDVNDRVTLPGGFGDVQFFDLFILPVDETLTLGVGPVAIFPTATSKTTGQGKYQVGPAGVVIYTGIEKWQFGGLAQQLWSVGSTDHRPSTNQMIYQIIATRHFEEGYYMGFCGQPCVIDWTKDRAQFPAGFAIGRVFPLGKQLVNINVTPTYYLGASELQPRLQVQFNFALIYGK